MPPGAATQSTVSQLHDHLPSKNDHGLAGAQIELPGAEHVIKSGARSLLPNAYVSVSFERFLVIRDPLYS